MILYITNEIKMPKIPKRKVTHWIKRIAAKYDKKVGEIALIFCSKDKILTVNQSYLSHNYYTDIITFDYSYNKIISGDLFISVETVKSNAETYNVSFTNELYRVIIHGILHLCGVTDKTIEEKKICRKKENEALVLLRID